MSINPPAITLLCKEQSQDLTVWNLRQNDFCYFIFKNKNNISNSYVFTKRKN